MLTHYANLKDAVKALRLKNYGIAFHFKKNCLVDESDDSTYLPYQLTIDEYHRFEPDSLSDKNEIVFAMCTFKGKKGLFIPDHALFSDKAMIGFLNKVRISILDDGIYKNSHRYGQFSC